MKNMDIKPARLSENLDHIVDSDGHRVEYDDPRIVHIGAIDHSSYTKRLMTRLYQKHNRKLRTIDETSAETMQYARKVCSGRECVPMTAIAGATVNDLYNCRTEDEISIYFTLDQLGPCQNGAWPLVWEAFGKRLNVKNAVFGVWPSAQNQYVGFGEEFTQAFTKCFILGDFFEEAKNALEVLARDKDSAFETFEAEFGHFSECFIDTGKDIKPALQQWARKMAQIPLQATVAETPKILIFGGLNLVFVHYPLTDYFIGQDIIPKVVDATEGMLWLASESIMRNGFKRGLINPEKQFNIPSLFFSWVFERNNKTEAKDVLKKRIGLLYVDMMMKQFRKIMAKSGLMFDVHISFPDLAAAGHKYVTYNGFTETPVATGRYLRAIELGLYDGLINLGTFNCQPAMNSQAIIRPLANKNDVPYAAIDCEGPWLSANQRRLLEAVAVQAKRNKNGRELIEQ